CERKAAGEIPACSIAAVECNVFHILTNGRFFHTTSRSSAINRDVMRRVGRVLHVQIPATVIPHADVTGVDAGKMDCVRAGYQSFRHNAVAKARGEYVGIVTRATVKVVSATAAYQGVITTIPVETVVF